MQKQIIYLHGLDSTSQAKKAQLLMQYCQQYHADIQVLCPDLNRAPHLVVAQLQNMIEHNQQQQIATAIVGSSLGGFYATYLYPIYQLPSVLINPSLLPYKTLPRLFQGDVDVLQADDVLYQGKHGWHIRKADLLWFNQHQASDLALSQRQNMTVLLKTGDDVLDYRIAEQFFRQQGIIENQLLVEQGGDHVMSDFIDKIPFVIQMFEKQWQKQSSM